MRRHVWAVALPLVLAGVIAACGGDDEAARGTGVDGDAGTGTDGAAIDPDAVVVRSVARNGFVDGKLSDARIDWIVGLSAIVTVDGVTRTIPGTINPADGVGTISGVPRVPFVLELREGGTGVAPLVIRRYPLSELRNVRLGSNYWRRGDTVAMTPTTKLGLSLTLPKGLDDGDTFSWLGPESHFVRELRWYDPSVYPPSDQSNVPAANASSSTDWTAGDGALYKSYGDEASGLPVATAGDRLFLFQSRDGSFGGPENDESKLWNATPFTSVVGMLEVPGATFANETTNTVQGTLAAPPTETVNVAFRGSTFAAMRNVAKYPMRDAWASAEIAVSHDVGPGPELFLSPSIPSWKLTSAPARWIDNDVVIDPGDLTHTFDAPHLPLTGFREFVDTTYTWYFEGPTPRGKVFYSTASTARHRKTSATITSALELGPVQNLVVGETALGWDGAGAVKAGPLTVRFDAPALGTAEHYLVKASEARPRRSDDGEDSFTVAYIYTRETVAAIPAEVLRPGTTYFVTVTAIRDGRDFAEPHLMKSEDAVSTSVFSPPFLVE